MLRLLIVCLFLISSIYGHPLLDIPSDDFVDRESRIVGGSLATTGQFPYLAALRTPANLFFCSSIIISNRWVISAAHCTITRDLPISFRVVVGTLDHRTGTEHALTRVVNHPSYNAQTIANDISLIQVSTPFVFSNTVAAVNIGSTQVGAGVSGLVAGWGATTTGGAPSQQKRWFQTVSLTNPDCQARFRAAGENRAADILIASKMCSFTRSGQGFCQGDSGGGFVASNTVHGIVSWNIPCGRGVPDVFTRVSSFRSWINSVTGL